MLTPTQLRALKRGEEITNNATESLALYQRSLKFIRPVYFTSPLSGCADWTDQLAEAVNYVNGNELGRGINSVMGG